MARKELWWAAAIVLGANLAAWGAAALNREGEPEAVLVLAESELRLPVRQAENTALTLALVFQPAWTRAGEGPREAGWFDRAKLESIGFDCRRPVTPESAAYYRVRPPRAVFAALEHVADAPPGSRLVVVDVDTTAAALRARHPDRRRVAVVEATAVVRYVSHPGQAPFIMGLVTSVLPGEIHVPRQWRAPLAALQPDRPATTWTPGSAPRYRATIAWGRRLEPWITNVELLK